MKKIILFLLAFACLFVVSCNKDEKTTAQTPPEKPPKQEVYQPVHTTKTIDFGTAKTYNYSLAPTNVAAQSVKVVYDLKYNYTQPIKVIYTYKNGDTFTYVINNFGIWCNENMRPRVIYDNHGTVWIQGQTKKGKFHEFVFFGDPKFNGCKITPNSYRNLPAGEIKYRGLK